MSPTSNSDSTLASESADHDLAFYVSFGLIISARMADVAKIRAAIENAGGKIAFQTVSGGPLYLLRHYEVEQILQGDIDHLVEVHKRKSKERRVEK